jgi:hypothetical protein
MNELKAFVYSTFENKMPDHYLDGMVFMDDAIIIGNGGLEKFLITQNNGIIKEAAEGRFMLIYRDESRYYACVDDTGQDCLYYYLQNEIWAFSNSFLLLVEHLIDHGIDLSLNHAVLSNFFIQHSFGDSLVSNSTVIYEIEVLSLDKQLVIENNLMLIIDRPVRKYESISSVEQISIVLNEFISLWGSRIRALYESLPIGSLKADITGGIDSRVVLSLFIWSGIDLNNMEFISNEKWPDDYRIACKLANKYGFRLNTGLSKEISFCMPKLSQGMRYRYFKYGSLGVYHPAYLPLYTGHPLLFHFGGSCGESLRPFYSVPHERMYDLFRKFFPSDSIFIRCKTEILNSLRKDNLLGTEPHSMIRHYQHSRARFHFGRNWYKSLTNPLITPLASRKLYNLVQFMDVGSINNRLLLMLIMLKVDPDLCRIPFDKPEKSFSAEMIKSLEKEEKAPLKDFIALKVYLEKDSLHLNNDHDDEIHHHDVRHYFIEDLSESMNNPCVRKYFSDEYISAALNELETNPRIQSAARKSNHIILLKVLSELGVKIKTI